MKSEFLKKIIAIAVVGTSISTFIAPNAFAIDPSDFYAWQNMNYGQSNGYWKQYNGKWYYSNYDGTMQTGWVYDNGQWYYMDSSGIMQTGVVQINGKIHIFSESGAMQSGNAVINGKYYTFDQNGAAIGKNVPTPTKAFDISGAPTIPYSSNDIITDEDSSPSDPNTVARDPNNLIKYNVTFKDDDGDEFSTKSIEKDDKITLYKPTKSGYSFVEWTTKKNGDGKSYDAGDSITIKDDITLYAQWEEASTSDPDTENDVLVEDITVASSTGTISSKAGTLQMSVKILPIDATNSDVTWSVSDETKASISSSGLLTAKANGTISVIATAKDTSKVVGRTTILITGQADSGTTNPGDGTTTPGGGTTTPDTGGKITAFDPNVKLTDVVIETAGNIVDLQLLKTSGELPTKAKVTCSLSNGTVKDIEIGIKDWTGTYKGAVGSYTLHATLGDLPSGYTMADTASIPNNVQLNVIVRRLQNESRKAITGGVSAPINLEYDRHIVKTEVLNASGILPKTVTLNYDGGDGKVGTVVANVKSWNCTNFAGAVGTYDLVADIESPVGYYIPSDVLVTTKLNVKVAQTANIQEIVGVVKNANPPLVLDYVAGEKLDLSNLIVDVNYNNGETHQISYDKFAANNITTPGYFQGMILSTTNSTTLGIPVMFNNKKVYTEPLKVSAASAPTITADGITTYSTTTPSAVKFNYTLGSGTNEAKGIESVTLNAAALNSGTDYTIDADYKKLIISEAKLTEFIKDKKTPATYELKVTFTPKTSTTKPTLNATIGFISKPAVPSGITLAPTSGELVPAKDNTIKLLGLALNVTYEYWVGDPENWSNAKYFTATAATKELTDTSFVSGKKLYIRVKSISAGSGAVNPPSDTFPVGTLDETTIGKTLSSEKSIKSFSLNCEGVSYAGTITEGSSSGVITVIVPTTVDLSGNPIEMAVSNLTANFTLSDKATLKVGETDQASGTNGTGNNFTNQVIYTVTAQNETTKIYTVKVVKSELQASLVRSDTLYYPQTKTEIVDGIETITTISTPFNILNDGYENAVSIIDSLNNGLVSIALPSTFNTDEQKEALDKIRELTPYTNPQLAYVGMVLTKPSDTNVASLKSAATLDDLKNGKNVTTVELSSIGTNPVDKQYLEQIPIAMFGSGTWLKLSQPTPTTKYYAWIDSSGKVIKYTSLTIKVV